MSRPAKWPQRCRRCKGSGVFVWGGTINGKPARSGECYLCGGTGWIEDAEQVRHFIRESALAWEARAGAE